MRYWPLALLALPGALPAQEGSVLPLGVRIRVSTSRERVTGILARLRDDTVAVVPDGRDVALAVPFTAVEGLEVSRGRFARTGRGALIGLGIGLAGGIATGIAVCRNDQCESSGFDGTGIAIAGLGLGGALVGTGIGALVGSFIHQEKWRDVSIRWMRAGPAPGGVGISLSFSTRFP